MLATIGPRPHQLYMFPWLLFVVVVGVMVVVSPVSGFNLEPKSAQIFSDPTRGNPELARESYFGFSIALQSNPITNSAWLVVGAPRANSSQYISTRITEPGAIFKCDLSNDQNPCIELRIDQTGNEIISTQGLHYQDLKNEGWLGAALDSQPSYKEGRQATGVCAPRWINQAYVTSGTYLMNGACYWLNASLSDAPAHKKLPLLEFSKQTFTVYGRSLFYFAHGQAGLSLHFPDDNTEMIVGAPGVFNWQGSVIRFKDASSPIHGEISFRRRRRRQVPPPTIPEFQMFKSELVVNPYYTTTIQDFDLNGYSVTSGRFFKEAELLYASGAPRGASTFGKVYVFAFPDRESEALDIRAEWQGTQLGENFGASLVSADINGDGLSDLVVGSPMYTKHSKPDMGRIQVFLSVRAGNMELSGSYHGLSKSSARFGTTLASPGDLNHDGYDDIAVGAPWEDDDKGAVYIYMGSKGGLRQVFAQRLSTEDFPAFPNLGGFGMAISRGIDIDSNDYPDLAIGSFMSGHAIVLRSRTVASLKGHMTSTPSTLSLEGNSLTLEACVRYEGYRVPRQVDVRGSITLDYGHPSPRASFRDTGLIMRKFNIMGIKNKTQCFPYEVDVKANKIDPRRPILVRLEYTIPETSGQQLLLQPKTDPGEPKMITLPISIVTGCEEDGDKTCSIDMNVEVNFENYRDQDKLTIGGDNKPVMKIAVHNLGESVFLPNVTVQVPKPFALFMPSSHNCDFPIKDSRTMLVCHLVNPIKRGRKDTVRVIIDASGVTDVTNELTVDVKVAGEGVEMTPADNILAQKLQLLANADLKLHGYSREEQLSYQRIDADKINTTLSESTFTHYYTLVKSGPTPLGMVELIVDIPINFTNNANFITLYGPQTNFLGQTFLCTVEGITIAVENTDNGDGGNIVSNFMTNITDIPAASRDDEINIKWLEPGTVKGGVTSKESSLHEVQTFRCPSEQVSCATVRCQISSWPSGSNSAEFSIKMDVNFDLLASHISARGGAIVSSTATASILSLSPDLTFVGNKETTTVINTQFLPDSLPGRGVAWWIIVLAVLGGLLLLILLAYILYKMGFFTRKEHEEMKAQRAQVMSNGNDYGALDEE